LSQIEDALNEKASKSSVAQALHRKVNWQDFDLDLQKKADLRDFERIIDSIENKVDKTIFESVTKNLENMKANKIEVDAVLSRTGTDKDIESRGLMAKMRYDLENRFADIEAQ